MIESGCPYTHVEPRLFVRSFVAHDEYATVTPLSSARYRLWAVLVNSNHVMTQQGVSNPGVTACVHLKLHSTSSEPPEKAWPHFSR